MSSEEQFYAAVNVIKNLPTDAKNAPFQPSDSLKLKFYAYFKQATEGPNETSKPSFYDIVGKYKWNAWKNLGNMSKDDAMKGYVSELKKIIETMSLTQPVADFYEVLGPFYEFVEKKKVNGQVNGNAIMIPEESVPALLSPTSNGYTNGDSDKNGGLSIPNGGAYMATNGSVHDGESDAEEFSDTFDHMGEENGTQQAQDGLSEEIISARGESELSPPRFLPASSQGRPSSSRQQGGRATANTSGQILGGQSGGGGAGGNGGQYSGREPVPEVNEQIALAVLRLQQGMEQVVTRIGSIESQLRANPRPAPKAGAGWWPFPELSPSTAAFLVLWPFVAHVVISVIRERRRQ